MKGTSSSVLFLIFAASACKAHSPTSDAEGSALAPVPAPSLSASAAGGCSKDDECLPGYCDGRVCRAFRTEQEPCRPNERCAAGLACMSFPEPGDQQRGLCVLEVAYSDVSTTPDRFTGRLIGIRDVALLASVGGCSAASRRRPSWCDCGGGPMYLSETGRYVGLARRIAVPKYQCEWFGCSPKCPVPAGKRYRIAGRLGGRDRMSGLPNRELTIVAIQMLEDSTETAKR